MLNVRNSRYQRGFRAGAMAMLLLFSLYVMFLMSVSLAFAQDSAKIVGLQATPTKISMETPQKMQFSVYGLDNVGNLVDVTLDPKTQYMSNNESIALVDPGVVVGLTEGDTSITVNYEGLTTSVLIPVHIGKTIDKIKTFKIVPNPLIVKPASKHEPQQLTATATFESGKIRNVENYSNCIWSSYDPSIAVVDHGEVLATTDKLGSWTWVSATYEGLSAKVKVIIQDEPIRQPSALTVDQKNITLYLHEFFDKQIAVITASAIYDDGKDPASEVINSKEGSKWESSNSDVVEVDQDGLLTAISPGTATVSVYYTLGTTTVKDSVNVTVKETPTLTKLVPLPKSVTIKLGESKQVKLMGYFGKEFKTVDIASIADWSSKQPTIVSADKGLITALAKSTRQINVTATFNGQVVTIPVRVSSK